MTARIREFLKRRTDEGPCLVVDLDVVRDNYQSFAKALPDSQGLLRGEGQSGAGDPQAAGRARRLLRRRLGGRDRGGAGRRRHARPHLLRQHDQEGERDRRRLQARRHAVRRRLRGRGREGRARRARLPGDLPHPLRRRRRRMAAVAQVRLRAGLCRRHPGARPPAGPRAPRHLVPCRLAAAQRRSLGPRARLDRGDLPHLRRARHQPGDGQSRRRLPGQIHPQDAEARILRQGDLPLAAQAFRQRHSRTPSSSRAAASSAMPA